MKLTCHLVVSGFQKLRSWSPECTNTILDLYYIVAHLYHITQKGCQTMKSKTNEIYFSFPLKLLHFCSYHQFFYSLEWKTIQQQAYIFMQKYCKRNVLHIMAIVKMSDYSFLFLHTKRSRILHGFDNRCPCCSNCLRDFIKNSFIAAFYLMLLQYLLIIKKQETHIGCISRPYLLR